MITRYGKSLSCFFLLHIQSVVGFRVTDWSVVYLLNLSAGFPVIFVAFFVSLFSSLSGIYGKLSLVFLKDNGEPSFVTVYSI